MLSVLIPIYNQDVMELALELRNQCQSQQIQFEIVCYDDASEDNYRKTNRALDQEFGISYIELSENYGRSKIRNTLARNARFENILFLDGDSKIENKNFIANYLKEVTDSSLIYGGRIYQKQKPNDEHLILHWKYGKNRESKDLKLRLKQPYRSFQTNNFLTTRKVMQSFPFDENINSYGYEDLLFAEKLKEKGIAIHHIDNPLIHNGLEDISVFMSKSKSAAENLAILYHSGLLSNTKMVDFHERLEKIGFNSFLHKLVKRRKDQILKNLHSQNPNLFYFDLYRYDIFFTKINAL